MKILSYFGAIILVLTIFSSCKKEQLETFPEHQMMCKTSYGDFVPCYELEKREEQYSNSGLNKAEYDYVWSSCTYVSREGEETAGGQCTSQEDGGCTDEHDCLPCGNC